MSTTPSSMKRSPSSSSGAARTRRSTSTRRSPRLSVIGALALLWAAPVLRDEQRQRGAAARAAGAGAAAVGAVVRPRAADRLAGAEPERAGAPSPRRSRQGWFTATTSRSSFRSATAPVGRLEDRGDDRARREPRRLRAEPVGLGPAGGEEGGGALRGGHPAKPTGPAPVRRAISPSREPSCSRRRRERRSARP